MSSLVSSPRIRDIAWTANITPSADRESFYAGVKNRTAELQTQYIKQVFALIDLNDIEQKRIDLWSKIEPLIIVDENDIPFQDGSGWWTTEFRKDFGNITSIPESRERSLFCRIALFIIEDTAGNIIVSRRSLKKSSPGELEMAGWHVTAGDSYLETIYKEVEEELDYKIPAGSLTEDGRLFKYRNFTPWDEQYKWKWNMVTVYNITVPSIEAIKFDPAEIEELIVLNKEELFEAISTGSLNWATYKFAPHHAYWYLEYLEQNRNIDTTKVRETLEKQWVMKNRMKIQTFTVGE